MKKKHRPGIRGPYFLKIFFILFAMSLVIAAFFYYRKKDTASRSTAGADSSLSELSIDLAKNSTIPSAQAISCGQCHQGEYKKWEGSQHAWANRLVDIQKDSKAFSQDKKYSQGAMIFQAKIRGKDLELSLTSAEGKTEIYHPFAVMGIAPLLQYLVPFPGGRLQVFDWAFDPMKQEWFYVFGNDTRGPHDWGYWKNRGMNWNSQCAACHMSGLKKSYDVVADRYHTTWQEMGVSCIQCHRLKDGHPEAKLDAKQIQETCATCHSRHETLREDFKPGDKFSDHYRVTLPDTPEMYYPDGQVREEDFEYGSFLLSKMGNKGVTCVDCHDPHSGKLRVPVENNQLCLSCHGIPASRGAVPIEVLSHTHHSLGSAGSRCVECHMPETVYMQRDARRDHGFTIPDPLLTKELGIPNSCNRCHKDQSVDWAITWVNRWHGAKMERPSRQRARVIAMAQDHDDKALPQLVDMARVEENPAWRATLVSLLGPWAERPRAMQILLRSLKDDSPLVRSAAVRALQGVPEFSEEIRPLLEDPSRLGRLDASWVFANRQGFSERDYRELLDYLDFNSDQPSGALRQGELKLSNGHSKEAEAWIRKAASWDQSSAYAQDFLGRVLNIVGKNEEALDFFRKAVQLDSKNSDYLYHLALLLAEAGHHQEALENLKITVRINPSFGRAFYNLGLAYSRLNHLEEALEALQRAETLMPASPEAPFATATVYLRQQNKAGARAAVDRVLKMQPAHAEALKIKSLLAQ